MKKLIAQYFNENDRNLLCIPDDPLSIDNVNISAKEDRAHKRINTGRACYWKNGRDSPFWQQVFLGCVCVSRTLLAASIHSINCSVSRQAGLQYITG